MISALETCRKEGILLNIVLKVTANAIWHNTKWEIYIINKEIKWYLFGGEITVLVQEIILKLD